MKIADILNNIDLKAMALPVFQRGYVWKRPQVKSLMNSLYRGYPVGSLLIWTTSAESVEVRGNGEARTSGAVDLLLDGQQRVTSLYGIMKGNAPVFFEGDAKVFSGLYFNLDNEVFDFIPRNRAEGNPLWVSVTDLFASGNQWFSQLVGNPEYADKLDVCLQRGMKVQQIRDVDLPEQKITGADKTTDVVVDIFNRVNSGGTKLSKGDLALARIGAHWPDARPEMQRRLVKWNSAGFNASLDWLLRCMNAILTGGSEFERLERDRISIEAIQNSLQQTENAVNRLLEAMHSYLHMDSDRLHTSKQSFPVMVKYLVNRGGRFEDQAATARLLHWYINVAIWGRFSGPTETIINQDLLALNDAAPIDSLLRNLRVAQGERTITQENFDLNYTTARFYPLLYMMSRIEDARDWGTGNRLRHHSLGNSTNLELHHIFPKAYLRRNGISPKDANNMGNIAFQTQETNRSIGSRPPAEYMPEIAAKWPGTLESQWIPMDPELWKVENYRQFIEARRRLLADSANAMLSALRNGIIPPAEPLINAIAPETPTASPTAPYQDDEEITLAEANAFALENDLPPGVPAYEIVNADTGELTATLDLAWPDGLQQGYSQPVTLLIDEDAAVIRAASDAGFKVFTNRDGFERYVKREILDSAA